MNRMVSSVVSLGPADSRPSCLSPTRRTGFCGADMSGAIILEVIALVPFAALRSFALQAKKARQFSHLRLLAGT
jgi:hypothetical protein